jgi:hypothetical protein
MITIYVWPDDSWCYEDEVEQMTPWKGDDYFELTVPEGEDTQKYLNEYLAQSNTSPKYQHCPKCDEYVDIIHIHR